MSLKRRNTSSPEPDDLPTPKRSKPVPPEESSSDIGHGHPITSHAEPRTDPLYGQKSAFPGLDDDSETLNYGEEPLDGIEYLRMVR